MRKAIFIGALLSGALLLMAARPGSEFGMLMQLNGQPQRWLMADGGPSGMFGPSKACMPVTGGDVLLIQPFNGIQLCVQPTDGGCNTTVTDENFGVYLPAAVDRFVVLDLYRANSDGTQTAVTSICSVPAPGSGDGGAAVFRLR